LAPDPIDQEIPLKFVKYDAEYIFEVLNSHGQGLTVDRLVEIRNQRSRAGDEEPESETRAAVLNLGSTYRLGTMGRFRGGGGEEDPRTWTKISQLYFNEALAEIQFSFNNECRQKSKLGPVGSKKIANFNKSIYIFKI
jgi:hypothetical protein